MKLSPNVRPAQLLITGDGPEHGQTLHLAPAILFRMEHIHSYLLDLPMLFRETGRSPEEACIQVLNLTIHTYTAIQLYSFSRFMCFYKFDAQPHADVILLIDCNSSLAIF